MMKQEIQREYVKLVLATISCTVIAFLYFANPFSATQIDKIIQVSGYYFCAFVVLGLGFFLYCGLLRKISWHTQLRKESLVILGILFIAAFVHLHEPHRFKVLHDEYAISSVAKHMHLDRKAAIPSQTLQIGEQIEYLHFYAGKRSHLFPFFVSVAHDLTGFRPKNVFWVNGLFTLGSLGLIYASVRKVTGSGVLGYWACLFAASIPLFSQVATSAGYDLANVFFIWLLIYSGLRFFEEPSDERMNVLVICGLALAYTRNESVLYLLAVVAFIAVYWFRERRIRLTWFTALSPLLLVLPVLLNLRLLGNEAFQDPSLREEGQSFFGWHYILPNLKEALSYFFSPTNYTTASVFCSVLGLIGVVFLAVTLFTRGLKKGQESILVVGCVLGVGVICFMVVMANFWGQLTHAYATRFALPLYVLSGFGVAILIHETFKSRNCQTSYWVPAMQLAYLLMFTVPTVAKHTKTREMVTSYYMKWVIDTVKAHDAERVLLLIKSNVGPGLYDISSLPLGIANADPKIPFYFARDYEYEAVWVVEMQEFDRTKNEWVEIKTFGMAADWMQLELLFEKHFYVGVRARISRLKLDDLPLEKDADAVDPSLETGAAAIE
jgi:hypothetical protein